jgi:hypothetical protein
MTDEEKEKIRRKIRNGYPEGEIKNQLRNEGLTGEEIREILTAPKTDKRSLHLVSAIMLLLLAVYLVIQTGLISLLFFGLSGLLFYEYFRASAKRD